MFGIEYATPLSSNLSTFSIGGFLGSKDPTPPAIKMLGVKNVCPNEVLASQLSPTFFNVSILWFRCIGVLKGSICFVKLSTRDWPVHTGSPGISYIGLSG